MRHRLPRLVLSLLPACCVTGQQRPTPKVVTAADWKRLHKHPKTSEEFRQCAQWCRQQAELNHQKESAFEAQLKALHARPANHEGPKYPPTQDELREEIEYYRGKTLHWTQLAADYDRKAAVR
jgi:hypothetical protein